MSSPLSIARHGNLLNASDILEQEVSEELLRAALLNTMRKCRMLEKRLESLEGRAR